MISCILLAAGSSTRFGSPKALVPLKKAPLIERLQKTLLETDQTELIIVLGARADKLQAHCQNNERIKTVVNPHYNLGQTSSFKIGLNALEARTKGIMLLPVDFPLVKPETIRLLIERFLKDNPLILVPTYENKGGHPPIFSRKILKELKNLKNEDPICTIQHRHETETLRLPVDDAGIIKSFNTPRELKNLLRQWKFENRK